MEVAVGVGDGFGDLLGAVLVGVGDDGASDDLAGRGPGDELGGPDIGWDLVGVGEGQAVECAAVGWDRRACVGGGLPAGGWMPRNVRATPCGQPSAPHALASSLGGCDRSRRLPTTAKAATPAPMATSQCRLVGKLGQSSQKAEVGLRGKER